jgi:hypothetical protein
MKNSIKKQTIEILKKWKANEISLLQAYKELCRLGYPPAQAWNLLETS